MNNYSPIQSLLFLFFFTQVTVVLSYQADDQLDVMQDFSYPVSVVESLRYDVCQSLFYLTHDDPVSALSFLDQAVCKLSATEYFSQDDLLYLDALCGQMYAFMHTLEDNANQLEMINLVEQIKSRL